MMQFRLISTFFCFHETSNDLNEFDPGGISEIAQFAMDTNELIDGLLS